MKGKRDSLRVWLEKNLNQNKIPGLEWKDPKKKIFRIRWKHASKHGWSSAVDGCVFREWAIYSGKFKPGEKAHEEPKVWKANFRCALNALPDIQEVVEERETRGNEAQKVFYMRPHFSKHSKRNRESSFRYRNNSSYQASKCYQRHFEDPNISQLRNIVPGSVWGRSSLERSRSEFSAPPPLLHIRTDKECFYSTEREGGASNHPKPMEQSEPIMSEHKIIELIDSWSNELKEKYETKFWNVNHKSMQPLNSTFCNGFVEPSLGLYESPHVCNQIQFQSACVPTSHYYLTEVASEESTESAGFDFVSNI